MIFALVELDDGNQHFFDTPYQAFTFAKEQEDLRANSVDLVAIGNFWTDQGMVYMGQELRYLLRAVDNIPAWLKESHEKDTDISSME